MWKFHINDLRPCFFVYDRFQESFTLIEIKCNNIQYKQPII